MLHVVHDLNKFSNTIQICNSIKKSKHSFQKSDKRGFPPVSLRIRNQYSLQQFSRHRRCCPTGIQFPKLTRLWNYFFCEFPCIRNRCIHKNITVVRTYILIFVRWIFGWSSSKRCTLADAGTFKLSNHFVR